ncbi:MAG TPA: PEP-CTERM sorting domain-containing protein [Candidatus Acidoferrales bacterium]|nr:PEP-CTERM sorting domain-containing protein [Candidatus Acidoferrales bacterium]
MRKLLSMILAVLFLAVIAPNVRADSVSTVTFTTDGCSGACTLPTATDVTFPSPTTMDVTFVFLNEVVTIPAGVEPGDTLFWIGLDSIGPTFFDLATTPQTCQGIDIGIAIGSCGSVTFSSNVATSPEPSSVPLLLLGTGFLIVTRKRWAKGFLQQAS